MRSVLRALAAGAVVGGGLLWSAPVAQADAMTCGDLPQSTNAAEPIAVVGRVTYSTTSGYQGPVFLYAGNELVRCAMTDAAGVVIFRLPFTGPTATAGQANGNTVNFRLEAPSGPDRAGSIVSRTFQADGRWTTPDGIATDAPEAQAPLTVKPVARAVQSQSPVPYRCLAAVTRRSIKPTALGEVFTGLDTTAAFKYGISGREETTLTLAASFRGIAGLSAGGSLRGSYRGSAFGQRFGQNSHERVFGRIDYQYEDLRRDRDARGRRINPKKGKRCGRSLVPLNVVEAPLRTKAIGRDELLGDCRNSARYNRVHNYVGGFRPNQTYEKDAGKAMTQTRAVSVLGFTLDSQSGYSTNVQTAFEFGKKYDEYAICGTGGDRSERYAIPSSWDRVRAQAVGKRIRR